ncbi:MAG: LLM class flavin-dependent oxidoreductase [Chloroflexi bacterium]|nr:LLM class flavin-dependent oxidoreductase [Chloroflexota bacterium]
MSLGLGANLAEPALTVRHARMAEEAGFDFVGAGEHVHRDQKPGATQLALTALAAAAGATQRVRLLTSIVITPLHHPVMLAKEASVVDLASGGRLILGLGVGGEFPGEFRALGIPVHERGARTDEAIAILRKLWTGERVTHAGKHFAFDAVDINPRPAQPGGPPIWIGGRTDAALERAAKSGDGWLPYLFRPSHYARGAQTLRDLLTKQGKSVDEFGWGLHLMTAVRRTREESVQLAAASLEAGYKYDGSYRELAERYVLLGPPEEAVARLEEFHDAGVRQVLLSWMVPAERIDEQIQVVGEHVIPGIRAL